jgi:Tol biopolymer transport system component
MRAFAVLLFAIGVIGAVVSGGVAGAAKSAAGVRALRSSVPSRGVIAFECESCSSLPIWTIRWNGGRLHLRGDAGPEFGWSPTGRLFAYVWGLIPAIWVGTFDRSVNRRLTHPPGRCCVSPGDGQPAWFPSGKRLVFIRGGALWTVGSDGRGVKKLYAAPASANVSLGDPDVSPDGKRIAFDDSAGHLWVTGTRGLTAWRVGPGNLSGSNPRWSPDGTRIAFLDGGWVPGILDLRTNKVRDLGFGPLDAGADGYFSWSPDGRWLAVTQEQDYDCGDPTGPCQSEQLWIVNASDGRAQRVYSTSDGAYINAVDWH